METEKKYVNYLQSIGYSMCSHSHLLTKVQLNKFSVQFSDLILYIATMSEIYIYGQHPLE